MWHDNVDLLAYHDLDGRSGFKPPERRARRPGTGPSRIRPGSGGTPWHSPLVVNSNAVLSKLAPAGSAVRAGAKQFAPAAADGHDLSMESPPEHLTHDRVESGTVESGTVESGSVESGSVESGTVELRRWRASDADLCFRLVSESIEHLSPWMPWATTGYAPADAADYLDRCEASWADGTAFQYLIIADGIPAGSAGLMARIAPGGLEIGYWVHPACTGRGVATAASAALTDAAFALPGVDHVEIHHDQLNLASGRVPAKLGYTLVDTRAQRFDLAPGDSGTTMVWRITPAGRYGL